MTAPVYVLGGYQTDFARSFAREGKGLSELCAETVNGALAATGIDADTVDVGHVANFAGELFSRQGQLGGFLVDAHESYARRGLPTSRHEAACASGSVAVLAAAADIESGRHDVALVLGVELMRNVPGETAAEHLGAAAWQGRETDGVRYVWPSVFSAVGDEYERRYGLQREHLVALSRSNFENARRNANAQTRRWELDDRSYAEDDEKNPVIAGRIRKHDCSQITDGGAALFLGSERGAEAYAARRGLKTRDIPRLLGYGHTTARMAFSAKLEEGRGGEYVFPKVRQAITQALSRAGLADARALDAVETHDCFSTTHYMAIDHFALCPPGKAWQAIADGTVLFGGALPFNPSGGLTGVGHPVGASGVRMLLDAQKQVSGTAGAYQVEGAEHVATLNIGGSATTTVCCIVGRSDGKKSRT